MPRSLVAVVVTGALLWSGAPPAVGVVCEPAEGRVAEAIRSGWPPDAPYEYVFIGTI